MCSSLCTQRATHIESLENQNVEFKKTQLALVGRLYAVDLSPLEKLEGFLTDSKTHFVCMEIYEEVKAVDVHFCD